MPFTGEVEVDETFVGGRAKGSFGGGKLNKAIVMGAKERESKRVRARVVPTTKKEVAREFVLESMDPDSILLTDQLPSYRNIVSDHRTVNHGAYEYVRDMAHTNGIESFWATLKRAYKGTFHKLSHKHLSRYVDEFAGQAQRPGPGHAGPDGDPDRRDGRQADRLSDANRSPAELLDRQSPIDGIPFTCVRV